MILGYIRVSTDEQDAGLEAQASVIRRWAETQNEAISDVLCDEGYTGSNTDREGLRTALSALKQGDTLVVAKLDRLVRSVLDFSLIVKQAEAIGWRLVVLDANFDLGNEYGMAMAQMLAVFAELERKLISRRTREALAVKKAQGVQVGRPVELPRATVDTILEHRELGPTAIARLLESQGVPTARGGQWQPSTVWKVLDRAGEPQQP